MIESKLQQFIYEGQETIMGDIGRISLLAATAANLLATNWKTTLAFSLAYAGAYTICFSQAYFPSSHQEIPNSYKQE